MLENNTEFCRPTGETFARAQLGAAVRAICERSKPVISLLFVTLPVAAHHSQAIYDRQNTITIEGVVTDYRWTNPHTYLYVEVQNDAGGTVVWPIEGQVTAILRRLGWDSDTFAPGDHVTVVAHPSRDSARMMALLVSAEKAGVTFVGTTEALHIFLSNTKGAERPGTSGTPVPGYDARLVDDAGNDVTASDTPGYLQVRGPSLATGYWCRDAATRAAFQGEWLATGNVYRRSIDGYWAFLGRNNDMIKAGGMWVSPAEVEGVLVEHPDVLEAAVVGGRNQDGLEVTVAFLVPRSGHDIDSAGIEAHCRSRMAAFKRPRRIEVVELLPKTPTGKIQRFALRQRLEVAGGIDLDAES